MAWQFHGTYYAPCSCKVGCPCLLGETEADQGWCSGMVVMDIRSGNVDGLDVSGTKVALLADWPGGFLLGGGKGRLHFDPSVSQELRAPLTEVLKGKKGGVLEAIGALVPDMEVGADAPISLTLQGDEKTLTVGDFIQLTLTPLKGPTGAGTKVLNGAAAFREEVSLGRSSGSVRPAGMRAYQNERGHAEWDDFDWSA